MTISRARGTCASLDKLGSFMMMLLTRLSPVYLALSLSVVALCAPVRLVLSCLAEPRISTRACFCQPCVAILGTLPSSPILRLGGPQDLPL